MNNILERYKLAIENNNDEDINIISHEVMAADQELEDQGLNDVELNHVLGACLRTNFPNFEAGMISPYLKVKENEDE